MTPLTTTDDRPKAVPTAMPASQPKADRPKPAPSPVNNSPPKAERAKPAMNPLVPLHEALVAAGPGEVWSKVAESLKPLLQDWESYADNQKWDRLAANLAAATTIASGMSLLWERAQKYFDSDAETDGR